MERRRLGEEGSRSGREDGQGGTKEARLEGETAFHRPRPRIPSNEGLLRARKLPPKEESCQELRGSFWVSSDGRPTASILTLSEV